MSSRRRGSPRPTSPARTPGTEPRVVTLAEAAVVAAVFVLAGTVKGVIGLGLPTVALGLLAASVGLERAMALMLVPSFVTNVWQAVAGRHLRGGLRRPSPRRPRPPAGRSAPDPARPR